MSGSEELEVAAYKASGDKCVMRYTVHPQVLDSSDHQRIVRSNRIYDMAGVFNLLFWDIRKTTFSIFRLLMIPCLNIFLWWK